MTRRYNDPDLWLLHQEEARLWQVYVNARGDARRPAAAREARKAWEGLYRKVRAVLPPDELRRLIRDHVETSGRRARR